MLKFEVCPLLKNRAQLFKHETLCNTLVWSKACREKLKYAEMSLNGAVQWCTTSSTLLVGKTLICTVVAKRFIAFFQHVELYISTR